MLREREILDGKYEMIRVLGRGGMSTVYLCKNTRLGNLWAVKEVQREVKEYMDLLAEPNMLKELSHPGIPRIVDIFYEDDNLYIVEDYIKGETLESFIKREGNMKLQDIKEITVKICNIIEYLHSFKPPIIYRDLKPSNIMVTPSKGVVLVDFGISRTFKKGSESDTVYMGSKGYASPEQYCKGQSTIQTDIYGLGATMYHMALGAVSHSFTEPLRDEVYEGVDKRLKKIIQRAMQIDADDRYESVGEMMSEITRLSPTSEETVLIGGGMKNNPPRTILMSGTGGEKQVENIGIPKGTRAHKPRRKVGKIAVGVVAITIALMAGQLSLWNGGVKTQGASSKKKAVDKVETRTSISAAEKSETVELSPKPSVETLSVPSQTKDSFVMGAIDTKEGTAFQLDQYDDEDRGKARGKSKNRWKSDTRTKDLFYRLQPQASSGSFQDKFIMKLQYVATKGDYLAAYCTVKNSTGSTLRIPYSSIRIYDDKNEYAKAHVLESSPSIAILSDSKEHSIIFVFENFGLDTEEITIKTRLISDNPLYNKEVTLIADVE